MEDDLKTPVEGLVSRVDYRGVNPAVWFLYLEMYGKDSAQDLCRQGRDYVDMVVLYIGFDMVIFYMILLISCFFFYNGCLDTFFLRNLV